MRGESSEDDVEEVSCAATGRDCAARPLILGDRGEVDARGPPWSARAGAQLPLTPERRGGGEKRDRGPPPHKDTIIRVENALADELRWFLSSVDFHFHPHEFMEMTDSLGMPKRVLLVKKDNALLLTFSS
ncbi:hypothetical protein NDU88_002881 [Pleurodeles waltl]|uniref:Uncharacterized protein n=1 Tax=Pleurodeles waltl TaxID=8319 RepID=A0AAV7SEI4_PLEWA|nr:hypothetical protein NDU88_002881 [Pleurodeles waltl]